MKLLLLVSFLSLWRRSDGTGAALINMVVKEGNDAILPCSFSSRNIRKDLFDWKKDKKDVFMYDQGTVHDEYEQFRGRVSHFPDDLEVGNASIRIRATKLTDSGSYTCDFPRLPPERRSNIVLVVDPILKDRSDENISGATQEPSVTILDATKDWALLRCVVRGAFPKPEVHWQNRAGDLVPAEEPQVSERGGSYDIILQTTVNKTDHYRCVSTQKEINHQTYVETYVHLNEQEEPVHGSDADAGAMVVAVAVTAVVAVFLTLLVGGVVYFVRKKKTHSAVPTNSV